MDLHRHQQVIWRSRRLIAVGLLLGVALAVLATFRPAWDGGPKLSYRKAEVWTSTSKLLVTQNGFPWGRAVLPGASADGSAVAPAGQDTSAKGVQFVDPSRYAYLAWIYSHFLMGDTIRAMLPVRPMGIDIQAVPLNAGGNASAGSLPIIQLLASADTAAGADRLGTDAAAALESYLRGQQRASRVPSGQRVQVSIVNGSRKAELTKGHSPALGVVAFLLALAGTLALVYGLENLRQARRTRSPEDLFDVDDVNDPRSAGVSQGSLEATGAGS